MGGKQLCWGRETRFPSKWESKALSEERGPDYPGGSHISRKQALCSFHHRPRAFDGPHNSVPGFQAAAPPDPSPGSSASPWNHPEGHKSPRRPGPHSPFSALAPQRDVAPPLYPAPPRPQGPLGAFPSAHAPRFPRLGLSRAELLSFICALTFERLSQGLVDPAGPTVATVLAVSGRGRIGVEKPLAGCFR